MNAADCLAATGKPGVSDVSGIGDGMILVAEKGRK